jgi:hypothetical protein
MPAARGSPIKFFLCADYKFLLEVMGLGAATSMYACLYCKADKNNRDKKADPGMLGEMMTLGNRVKTSSKACDVYSAKAPPYLLFFRWKM